MIYVSKDKKFRLEPVWIESRQLWIWRLYKANPKKGFFEPLFFIVTDLIDEDEKLDCIHDLKLVPVWREKKKF